jgi:hypothetical protein
MAQGFYWAEIGEEVAPGLLQREWERE